MATLFSFLAYDLDTYCSIGIDSNNSATSKRRESASVKDRDRKWRANKKTLLQFLPLFPKIALVQWFHKIQILVL
jgi:hypothetical protein